jgi:Transglycosylase SLT domain
MLSVRDEPVSPELVLVCPELRERLSERELRAMPAEPGPEAEADHEPAPSPRPPLVLVTVVAAVALGLASGNLSGGQSVERAAALRPAPAQAPAQAVVRGGAVAAGGLVSSRAARRLAAFVPPARPRRTVERAAPKPKVVPHPAAPVAAAPSEIEPLSNMLGPLPDPTPRRWRLAPSTARTILAVARHRQVDWAMLTAVLRANRSGWPQPTRGAIRSAALWLSRHHDPANDGLLVTAQYDRAVGIDALISGLEGAKSVLGSEVLRDPRISIYPGGQHDIAAGRVDVRVLSLLLMLSRRTGEVTVSSLVTGHSAPLGGGRSAHEFGAAVEISSLGGRSVALEQQPGGLVDRTIRALLLLPDEVRPKHVTSLLDLGGSTFALPDYREHVQISFDPTIRSAPDQLHVLWQLAGSRYGVPWRVLAAINKIESNYGQNMGPSSAGAVGWMQFMPSTWSQWGVDANGDGHADPANPADAIFSAARYLAAAGAGSDLRRAIFAYNHADWYVNDVLRLASSYN